MVELVTGTARTDFTEAAYPRALGQLVFLGGVEVEKPHHQETAVVLEGNLQTAATPHHQVGLHDLTFHNGHVANPEIAHGHHPGAVLVPMRQMEQQILKRGNTQLAQLFGQGAAYALELGNRDVIQRRHAGLRRSRPQPGYQSWLFR